MGPERNPPTTLPKTDVQATAFEPAEGSECAIQTLYEGDKKCQCCRNWVVDYPEDLRVAVEDQLETKQKALVVRMAKNHDADNGGKPLVLHSVVVQSSSLRKTLCELFRGFRGITPSLKKLVFRAPFKPFHHRWERFTEILERQRREEPVAAQYTELLYDVLDAEIRDCREEVADLIEHGVITYERLWALFEPGVVVLDERGGDDSRFYVVDSRHYDPERNAFLAVTVKFVDWNGFSFGYVSKVIRIGAFAGTRDITGLPIFPAKFHPEYEEVKASAIARGRKFEELAGVHYRAYSGTIMYKERGEGGGMAERYTSGRIMIDAAGYNQADYPDDEDNHRWVGFAAPLTSDAAAPRLHVGDDVHIQHPVPGSLPPGRHRPPHFNSYGGIPPPPPMRAPSRMPVVQVPWSTTTTDTDSETPLTEAQLLLCTPIIRGYSLKLKLWCLFSVDSVTPITFNDTAFPNLMLPPTYKDLILSFVEAHPSSSSPPNTSSPNSPTTSTCSQLIPTANMFDDLIQGKGLGVVLLLVGNPGTGKTLTAEAVADKVRRPLYVLSAGELGQKAEEVERKLRDALELAEKWDAVLLFDECDVFLQERSVGGASWDLARNEIVAVFLRLLEYYRGILFMTTNRADTLDRAFHSRIHLTLKYPDLDEAAKEHIWRHFTTLAGAYGDEFHDGVYEKLARLPLNGRQIKNTVKMATLVAARQRVPLGVEHVRTALQAVLGADGVEVRL